MRDLDISNSSITPFKTQPSTSVAGMGDVRISSQPWASSAVLNCRPGQKTLKLDRSSDFSWHVNSTLKMGGHAQKTNSTTILRLLENDDGLPLFAIHCF